MIACHRKDVIGRQESGKAIYQLRAVVIANRECMDWQVYLAKAKNNLHTAHSAYAQGDFDSCTSRAYFAVFHAEIAALIKLTAFRQDRWGHDRVQEAFNRQLVRSRKVFPASLQTIHNDLIGRRHIADYTAQHISGRIAERCLRQATEMVTTIAGVLEAP